MTLEFALLDGSFAVAQLAPDAPIPSWADRPPFVTITRTHSELSIVCDETAVPDDIRADRNWRALEVLGPFAFDVTGVAAAFTSALATHGISVLVIATFDTDYLLVKSELLERALDALRAAGHRIKNDSANALP